MGKRVVVLLLLATGLVGCGGAQPTPVSPVTATLPAAAQTPVLSTPPTPTTVVPPSSLTVSPQPSPTAVASPSCAAVAPQPTQSTNEPTAEWACQFYEAKGHIGGGVVTDAAGNIFVAGTTSGNPPSQNAGQLEFDNAYAFVRQFHPDGSEGWTRLLVSGRSTWISALTIDVAGNLYVAGGSDGSLAGKASAGGMDAFVRQYHADGSEGWTRQFGTNNADFATAVAVDGAGNVYLVGTRNEVTTDNMELMLSDAFVRQYHADGTEGWDHQFITGETVYFTRAYDYGVAVDAAGNVYVGRQPSRVLGPRGNEMDWVVRQYHADGTEGWVRSSGRSEGDPLQGINAFAVDSSGNLYIAASQFDVTTQTFNAFVRQYLADGTEGWTSWSGDTSYEQVTGLTIDRANNIYLTLAATTGADDPAAESKLWHSGALDAVVYKYHPDGSAGWTYRWSTTQNDIARVAVDAAGNVYLAGDTWGGTVSGHLVLVGGHFFLVKLRPPDSPGS